LSPSHPPAHPPPPRRCEAEQARVDAALHDLFQNRIPFNEVLGLTLLSVRHGDVHGRFDMKPELVGHPAYGRLHGGVTAAVLDAVGGLAGMVAIAEHHAHETMEQVMLRFARYGTIDMRVDYLRPGVGRHFVATTEVTRLGGRIASTQMRLHNDAGILVATAAAAYSVS
jgi:uncharacterized protein (TIGR00369 family)